MIRAADLHEAESLTALINEAFRVEEFFVTGDRITLNEVRGHLAKGVFLVSEGEGTVYVELRGDRGYFGLLSVNPARQRMGAGKRLISAAEEYARAHGCKFMDITVVNLRVELPPFYGKLGYVENGIAPFPDPEKCKLPAHLVRMSKPL
jgi:GNAT superfamily N-acetyltransferase